MMTQQHQPLFVRQPTALQELYTNPRSTFLLDGGTGEELFRLGVPDDRTIWSATAIVHSQHHDTLRRVHESFLQAGSRAITTNSYGITPGVGFDNVTELKHWFGVAGQLARQAVQDHSNQLLEEKNENYIKNQQNDDCPFLVLGSMGPLVESYRPDLIMDPPERGMKYYKSMLEALEPHVDVFLFETMSCIDESLQGLGAYHQLYNNEQQQQVDDDNKSPFRANKPVWVSFTLNSKGIFRNDEALIDGLLRLLQYAEKYSIPLGAILFNCAEPEAITLAFQEIHRYKQQLQQQENDDSSSIPHNYFISPKHKILWGAYANRLTPVVSDWSLAESDGPQPMRKDLSPQDYYDNFVSKWIQDYQVQLIGGCCGIQPQHIAWIHQQIVSKSNDDQCRQGDDKATTT